MKRRMNGENSVYRTVADGRWHVMGYIDGKRQRVSRRTRTEALAAWSDRAARATAAEVAREAAAGTTRPADRSVSEIVGAWLDSRTGLSVSTASGYRDALRRYITPFIGSVPVSALNVEAVEQWQTLLLKGSDEQRALSQSTVRQARIVLRQALDQQVRYGHLPANPVALAMSLPKSRPVTAYLTAEEAAKVLRAADDPQLRARWLIALSLGLRSGEVLALRWRDIDLKGPQPSLHVRHSLKYQAGRGLVLEDTKTPASMRRILLAPEHVTALKAVLSAQQRQRLAEAGVFNPEGYLFTTSRGTPIDPNNDAKRWMKLLDKAGVRRVRRHDARHTAATLMLLDGTSPAVVQKVLGHSSISTTVDRYGHLLAADGAEATARLAASLTA